MSTRERLARFVLGTLHESDRKPEGELTAGTSLLESGLLDSLNLLDLAVWIEGEMGAPLDVTAVDVQKEWNTMADIVRFIERRRRA